MRGNALLIEYRVMSNVNKPLNGFVNAKPQTNHY